MEYDINPDRLTRVGTAGRATVRGGGSPGREGERVSNGYLAGVAGGLARRFDLDPAFVRLVWLASVLFFGLGAGVYFVFWWLMPHEDHVPVEPVHPGILQRARNDRKIAGVFAGIAHYFDKDPTLVRLIGLALIPCSVGLFLVAYLAAALIIPSASSLPRAAL